MANETQGALTQAGGPRWERRTKETVSGPDAGALSAMQERLRSGAGSTREALQKAREDIINRKRSQSSKWFGLAQAFTAPKHYGGMGETIGAVAGALGKDATAQEAFAAQQQSDLAGADANLMAAEQGLTKSEIDLMKLQKRTREVGETEGSYAPRTGDRARGGIGSKDDITLKTDSFADMLSNPDFEDAVGWVDKWTGKVKAQFGTASGLLNKEAGRAGIRLLASLAFHILMDVRKRGF